MNASGGNAGERVKDVRVDDHVISVDLLDGRTISAPVAWFPRLLHATPEQRPAGPSAAGGTGSTGPTSTRI